MKPNSEGKSHRMEFQSEKKEEIGAIKVLSLSMIQSGPEGDRCPRGKRGRTNMAK
jgi:hypothetical protein